VGNHSHNGSSKEGGRDRRGRPFCVSRGKSVCFETGRAALLCSGCAAASANAPFRRDRLTFIALARLKSDGLLK
jgi:hypothetical protein